jgi:hypothetical protein
MNQSTLEERRRQRLRERHQKAGKRNRRNHIEWFSGLSTAEMVALRDAYTKHLNRE